MLITKKVKEISNLPAGPELDLKITVALGLGSKLAPHYSTDHAMAFQLRLEMEKLGWESEDRLTWMGWGDQEDPFGYHFWFAKWVKHKRYTLDQSARDSKEAPLAIARCALLALTQMAAGGEGPATELLKELGEKV